MHLRPGGYRRGKLNYGDFERTQQSILIDPPEQLVSKIGLKQDLLDLLSAIICRQHFGGALSAESPLGTRKPFLGQLLIAKYTSCKRSDAS